MASLKQTLNAFNRVVTNISLVQLVSASPLNTVTFISLKEDKDLKKWSGATTNSEIDAEFSAGEMAKKIKLSLKQKTALGASILPDAFFSAGKVLTVTDGAYTDPEKKAIVDFVELTIKKVIIDKGRRFTALVFEDSSILLKDESLLLEIDALLKSWGAVMFLSTDDKSLVTQGIKDGAENTIIFKEHGTKGSADKGIDGAVAGRIVYGGVGVADGVAKELVGITPELASIQTGDGGDLTATEAQTWLDAGVNLYTKTVELYNETTGVKNPKGENFTNVWVLLKVASDVSSALALLRHQREHLSTSLQDQFTVQAEIASSLSRLKKGTIDPVTDRAMPGIIFDYQLSNRNLDYSIAENAGKFAFDIKVSLNQDAEWFTIGITGYKDGRKFEIEGA